MNEHKRLLSLVLAAVLVIGMMPTTVFAEETTPSTVATVPTTVATEPVTVAEVPTTAATEPSTVATEPTTTVTEPTVPETTVPETTVPETTVPETTVPETTVPETTVPETTVPETTVPETTVPETTVTTEPTEETTVPTTDTTESTEETTEATEETEPEIDLLTPGPQVGDTIWIKSGSKVYKNHNDVNKNFHTLIGNYKVEIKKILTNDEGIAEWYEFRFTDLGIGEIALSMGGYKYVHVENTSEQEPTEPECTCGTETDEHAEDCPLYVPVPSDTVTTEDGNTVSVAGLPEGGTLQIAEADAAVLSEVKADMESHFAAMRTSRTPNKIEQLFAYDISVLDADQTAWQPDGTVEITLTIPNLKVGAYEKVYIGHMHNGTVQMLETKVDHENSTITFTADGFSVFYGFIVDFEYKGYKFSIDGGSEVLLSEIMKELGISRNVSIVSNITFSNTSLISIERENGDWKLTSLQGFNTVEWLVIHFNDGSEIEIKVTDPILKYYLNDTAWCLATETAAVNGVNRTTNKEQIVGTNLGSLLIYARPGMAIRFTRFSGSWTSVTNDGNWTWVWDSTNLYNYVVLKDDIKAVTTINFSVPIGTYSDDKRDPENDYTACEVKIVIVPDGAAPTLLKTALASAPDNIKNTYSIRELPVTLYNYDGVKYKNKYSNGGKFFSFRGVSKGVDVEIAEGNLTGAGNANGGGPVMGIFQDTLQGDEKLPKMVQGQDVDLFSSQTFDGKEIRNVQFEFVYDTEGYYTYSSNINHAQLSDDGTKVQLYREAMGTTASYALNGSSENYAAGGFYPYSDIRKAADSAGAVLDWNTWTERLASGYIKDPAPFGMDLVDSATKVQPYSTVDMHNGLQLAANFYLPADKRTPTGKEIVYQFTGDDDLWVFIDDKLVLDIGGGHTPVSGSINFTTGLVTVEGTYYTVGSSTAKSNYSKTFSFEGDKIHSLKIFYLERYAGVSNCRMRFNIPIVPDGAVLVSKELLNEDGKDEFAFKPDKDYTFTVYTAADDDNVADATNFEPLKNAAYTIVGTDESHTTGEDGKFTLKAGQTAQFEGITHFTEVYVVEHTPDDGYKYVNPKVAINGTQKSYTYGSKTDTMVMPDGTLTFSFTNYMELSDLTITKDVLDSYQVLNENDTYSFTVDFFEPIKTGDATPVSSKNDTFSLKDGESKVIKNIPTNMSYTVVETAPVAPNGYEFKTPTYGDCVNDQGINDDTATTWENVILSADDEVVVTNEIIALYGNLKITKKGINPLDHHAASGRNLEENQSTIYKVTGTSDSGETVDLEVVIVGGTDSDGESVTIMNVPVGTYTVTELADWSWRYDAKDAEKKVTVTGGNTATAAFENDRNRVYWLSGDNYALNLFDGDLAN